MLHAPWQTTQCCSNKGSHAASLQNNQKTKGATFGYHYWRMWLPAGKCVMYFDGSIVLTEAQGNGNHQAQQETFLFRVSMPPLGASALPSIKGKAVPTVSQVPSPLSPGFWKDWNLLAYNPRMWSGADLHAWGLRLWHCQHLLCLPVWLVSQLTKHVWTFLKASTEKLRAQCLILLGMTKLWFHQDIQERSSSLLKMSAVTIECLLMLI